MYKHKGVEQPISMIKCWLPDVTFNQLEMIKNYLGKKNNVETLIEIISNTHGLMEQWQKELLDEHIKQEELKKAVSKPIIETNRLKIEDEKPDENN